MTTLVSVSQNLQTKINKKQNKITNKFLKIHYTFYQNSNKLEVNFQNFKLI